MNDEQFVEAARVLAQRVLDGAREDELRMERLFLLCTARRPDAADRLILAGALTAFRDRFQADEAAARELLQVGESVLNADLPAAEFAAWTMLANTVLNLDETLVRD